MPIVIQLGSNGGLLPNQTAILRLLSRAKKSLQKLPVAKNFEICLADPQARYNGLRIVDEKGDILDHELGALGVVSLCRRRDSQGQLDDNVCFENSALTSANKMYEIAKGLEKGDSKALAVLLHVILTTGSSGPTADHQIEVNQMHQAINSALEQIITATGIAGPLGLMASGNFGAFALMPILAFITKSVSSVLGGGFGTRTMGNENFKGDTTIGHHNLNVLQALISIFNAHYLPPTPKSHSGHKFVMSNDSPTISAGEPTCGGRALSEVGSVTKADIRQVVGDKLDQVWAFLEAQGLIEKFEVEAEDKHTKIIRGLVTEEFKSEFDSSHNNLYQRVFIKLLNESNLGLTKEQTLELYETIKDADKVMDIYFFGSPHNRNDFPILGVTEDGLAIDGTVELGMAYVLLKTMGEILFSTEKKGAALTQKLGEALLAVRNQHTLKGRSIVNWYGAALTYEAALELYQALQTHISGATIDSAGDGDTYGSLFAALTAGTPEQFAQAISKAGMSQNFLEDTVDKVLVPALQKVLYRTTTLEVDGKKYTRQVARAKFIETNVGGTAFDLGTLKALFKYYIAMVKYYQPTHDSQSRTDILKSIEELEKLGTRANLALAHRLEAEAANTERVWQAMIQRLGNLDPTLPLEECVFHPVSSYALAPRIAVRENPLPESINQRGFSSLSKGNLQRMISGDEAENIDLMECRRLADGSVVSYPHEPNVSIENKDGELLFIYDPARLASVKLYRCEVLPNARVAPDHVALGAQIGNGQDIVTLPSNGITLGSQIKAPVSHEQPPQLGDDAIYKALVGIAKEAEGSADDLTETQRTHIVKLDNGWTARFRYVCNEDAQTFATRVVEAADEAFTKYYQQTSSFFALSEFSNDPDLLNQQCQAVASLLNGSAPTQDQLNWLNKALKAPNLVEACSRKATTFTPEIFQLIQATAGYRGRVDFAKLADFQQNAIVMLNRQLLENAISQTPKLAAKSSIAGERKEVETIIRKLRRRAGLEQRGKFIPVPTSRGVDRLAESDGSSTHFFELCFEHKDEDPYILSNLELETPRTINRPMLVAARTPAANAGTVTYEAGFADSPSDPTIPILAKKGRSVKDLTSSYELAAARLFEWRSNQELIDEMLDPMVAAVDQQLRLMPFLRDMPLEAAQEIYTTLKVGKAGIKSAIKRALEEDPAATSANVEEELIWELTDQTPQILSQFLSQALNGTPFAKSDSEIETILTGMKPTDQDNQKTVTDLIKALAPKTDTESANHKSARGMIRSIVHSYPLAEMFFSDARSNIFSMKEAIEKLVKFHRIRQISLSPVIDPLKAINLSSDSNVWPQLADESVMIPLDNLQDWEFIRH